MAFSFSVKVAASFGGSLRNTAAVDFDDGAQSAEAQSNLVLLDVDAGRLGVAEAAGATVANLGANGAADGTATVVLSFLLKNYGAHPLYDLQLADLLEGTPGFGAYTSAALPGPGQYTLVPGSLSVSGVTAGSALAANGSYTGANGAAGLLQPGASLAAGGSATISFAVRFYTADRSGFIYNASTATAAQAPGGPATVADESVNGSDPDPDGDGDPRNNASPTPIRAGLSLIGLSKSSTTPMLVPGTADTFTFEYHLKVSNLGNVPLEYLRIIDNLDCAFLTDQPNGPIAAWQLTGAPTALRGILRPAGSAYTGHGRCNRGQGAAANASAPAPVPMELALSATDGSRALQPGESEEVVVPVKVTRAPAAITSAVVLTNTAYAAAFDANRVNGATLVASASATHDISLTDPSGVVYRSADRTPVAGAGVTLRRGVCTTGAGGPITAAELEFGDQPGRYTFNPDGSATLLTGADGVYQFILKAPPGTPTCDYTLAVTPPPGLAAPSTAIPPAAGPAPGGAVQAQTTPPAGSQSTTYYLAMRLGPGLPDVWNNHIPLDADTVSTLSLKKTGSKATVELADFITYTLSLSNLGKATSQGFSIQDRLPAGFAYVPGSARLTDASGNSRTVADPAQAAGSVLTFQFPAESLAPGTQLALRYRVRVGVGAMQGDGVNRAVARSGDLVSNEAAFRVTVTGGVFSDEAILFGKVYLDCNRNGVQDDGELGVPGVRILLENGTSVVTDVEGKWSLYGLRPVTHVVKLDKLTLPEGALLSVLSARNAGQPDSRFADLRKGELHKADFAITNCGAGDGDVVMQAVIARRKALESQPASEGEAMLKRQLDAQGKPYTPTDVRALPAAGTVGTAPVQPLTAGAAKPVGGLPVSPMPPAQPQGESFAALNPRALADPESRQPLTADAALAERVAVASATSPAQTPLEDLLESLDSRAGFIGLADRATLPTDLVNLRVKGRLGSLLRLTVNGQVVPERRVGKKADLLSRELTAWEYIGVALRAGENKLLLEEVDAFLIPRQSVELTVVAPGRPARLLIDVSGSAIADGHTPLPVTVRLVDEHGVPVTTRTPITLEASLGRWQQEDLNPMEPGTQLFMEGGSAELSLVPPAAPGTATLRISSGLLTKDAIVDFLPELRPLVGAGILEGVIDLRSLGRTSLQPARAKDSFEAELSTFSAESSSGRASASARAAFYFKGAIKGEYLLTTAYDSDKATRDRLFRDIQPDEFYPVYGDSSVKSFDAQSTGRFYVRIDKNKSYLLYGDFNTASSPEVRQLSQFSRSVTGLQHHFETGAISGTAFASRDSLRQVVQEFPANGTSGPFQLGSGGNFYANSEKVELILRDRRLSSNVLSVTPLARFTDYDIDATTGRLLMRAPVPSVDENLNPRAIRVTYEVDSGGPAFWVAGAELQLKITDAVQVGVTYGRDQDPTKPSSVAGANAIVRLGEKSVLTAEAAQTQTAAQGRGFGARVEIKHEGEQLKLRAQATQTDNSFDNASAYAQKGRTDALVSGSYKLSGTTALTVEAIDSRDQTTANRTAGVLAGVTTTLADGVQLEAGARIARQEQGMPTAAAASGSAATTPATAAPVDLHTLRAKLTVQPASLPQAKAYVEVEQDVAEAEKRLFAVGGSYQLGEKTRLYGRYEAISSLGNPFQIGSTEQNNVAAIGLESTYLEGHSAFSEFRVRDTLAGREDQLATGLRNTWQVSKALRLGLGFERTGALGGVAGQNSTALVGSADYTAAGLRADGRLELRRTDTADTLLNTLGVAYKLDDTWSLLGRSIVDASQGRGSSATDTLRLRQQLGLAYRPVGRDDWNALLRYEFRFEDNTGAPATTDVSPGLSRTHILSTHVNFQPRRDLTLSGRWAVKYLSLQADGLASNSWAQLLFGRALWDIAPKWDAGLQAMVFTGQGGARQLGLGVEAGYLVANNLWFSAGYNAFDLRDSALAGNDYLDRGFYVRLRFKFDEGLFK